MLHSRLSLETKIQKIKAEIMALGLELQPGLLTQQYNVCGSPGCRCKADPRQKHGPSGLKGRRSGALFLGNLRFRRGISLGNFARFVLLA